MVMLPSQVNELRSYELENSTTQTTYLPNISWKTYKLMLQEMGDHRSARVAYNQGILTIKMPSKLYELVNRLLARIVLKLTEELDLEVVNVGSTTIYQTLGVPEVWRYTKRNGVVIYHLRGSEYIQSSNSKAIPQLNADKLNEFLIQRQTQTDNQTIRSVRLWIQSVDV